MKTRTGEFVGTEPMINATVEKGKDVEEMQGTETLRGGETVLRGEVTNETGRRLSQVHFTPRTTALMKADWKEGWGCGTCQAGSISTRRAGESRLPQYTAPGAGGRHGIQYETRKKVTLSDPPKRRATQHAEDRMSGRLASTVSEKFKT